MLAMLIRPRVQSRSLFYSRKEMTAALAKENIPYKEMMFLCGQKMFVVNLNGSDALQLRKKAEKAIRRVCCSRHFNNAYHMVKDMDGLTPLR